MTALRQKHPGLKVSLGIGGWNEGSKNYSNLASSPNLRRTFVASTIEFLKCVYSDTYIDYPLERKPIFQVKHLFFEKNFQYTLIYTHIHAITLEILFIKFSSI